MIGLTVRRVGPTDEQVDQAVFQGLKRSLAREMQFLKADIQENWTKNKSIATGQLRRSISFGVDLQTEALYGWLGMELYWPFVEFGRPPGKMPPIWTPEGGGILRWVVAKGIVRNKDTAEKLGFKLPSGRVASSPFSGEGQDEIDDRLIKAEKAAAWAIAKAIEKNGVEARPAVEPALDDAWEGIVDELDRALNGEG